MTTKTVFCILRMLKFSSFKFDIATKEGCYIHWNREHIARQAVENKDITHLLFIDSDMWFEHDAAERLLKRDKDIIGVPYNLRKDPPTSTMKMHDENGNVLWQEYPDGLIKAAAVATGFMLIKTNVFEKIQKPWFFFEANEDGDLVTGEDMWFCFAARKAGFDIWADSTISVKHIGDKLF